MGKEVTDKENAERDRRSARAIATSQAPGGPFPGRIARATVAAAMLDEAEATGHRGEVVVAAG